MTQTFQNLTKAFNSWLRFERRYSPNTVAAYDRDLASMVDFLQNHLGDKISLKILTTLSLQDLRAFLAFRLKRGYSHRSNARALSVWRSFLGFLEKRYDAPVSHLLVIRSPKVPRSLPRATSHSIVLALFDAMEASATLPWVGLRDKALAGLLYGCGLRIHEALGLRLKDLAEVLHIKGKGGKERRIPMLEPIPKLISAYRAACPFSETPERFLFLGTQGRSLNPGVAQRTLRRARRSLGLEETLTHHALRHTFATELLKGGMDLRSLQLLLGHASLSSTQLYTNVTDPSLKETYAQAHPRFKRE